MFEQSRWMIGFKGMVMLVVLATFDLAPAAAGADEAGADKVLQGSTLWIVARSEPGTSEALAQKFGRDREDVASELAVSACADLTPADGKARSIKLAALLDEARAVVLAGDRRLFQKLCSERDQHALLASLRKIRSIVPAKSLPVQRSTSRGDLPAVWSQKLSMSDRLVVVSKEFAPDVAGQLSGIELRPNRDYDRTDSPVIVSLQPNAIEIVVRFAPGPFAEDAMCDADAIKGATNDADAIRAWTMVCPARWTTYVGYAFRVHQALSDRIGSDRDAREVLRRWAPRMTVVRLVNRAGDSVDLFWNTRQEGYWSSTPRAVAVTKDRKGRALDGGLLGFIRDSKADARGEPTGYGALLQFLDESTAELASRRERDPELRASGSGCRDSAECPEGKKCWGQVQGDAVVYRCE